MEEGSDSRRRALLKEYGEVLSAFRLLTDIRFKLLAFLPIASAAAAVLLKDQVLTMAGLLLSMFGLVVTTGLAIYNTRNDQLYGDLVARAAAIERILGLPDGAFANRPRPWLTVTLLGVRCNVDHGTGVSTIYAASFAVWLFGIYAPVLAMLDEHLDLLRVSGSDTESLLHLLALILAIPTILVVWAHLRKQKRRRERDMRELAAAAVEQVMTLDMVRASEDSRFIARCAALSGLDAGTVRSRAAFYAGLEERDRSHYMLTRPKVVAMSHFVALLTDLSPLWIYDRAAGRRGSTKS